MTRQPPTPRELYEARQRAVLVKNLLGLLGLLIGVVGVGVVLWIKDPLLFLAVVSTALAVGGYLWATTEAD